MSLISELLNSVLLQELGLILRGEHPGWQGDRRMNGYSFLRKLANERPMVAENLATAVEHDPQYFSNVSGISPGTVSLLPKVLRNQASCL